MRFGFVTPRFGKNVVGGAEALVRELATRLARRGDDVHILTTTAKDNRTWANELPAGESIEDGMVVRRFLVDERNLEKWIPTQIAISEGMEVSIDDQMEWLANSVNSRALYSFIAANSARFDALFFAPYLFGTTFWGSQIAPERSLLIPCLHDEHYAYQGAIRAMFATVRGCLWNAYPERVLCTQLYGEIPGGVVGMGFEAHAHGYVESLEPLFEDQTPYIVYMGRKETGKNVQHLIDLFIAAKEMHPALSKLKLVIAGGGSFTDLHRPEALTRGDIVDIEQLSERDKHRLIKHALYLVQPSRNESFSIVLMEAWLLGTPVLVDSQCAVTKYQVDQSGGGLYFSSAEDLAGVLHEALQDPELLKTLSAAGARFVAKELSWEAVLRRFDEAIANTFRSQWRGEDVLRGN